MKPHAKALFHKRAPLLVGLLCWLFLAPRPHAAPLDQWIWRNPQPFCPQLQSVTHGAGLWLVFGGNVRVLATSVDGNAWDLASLGTNAASIAGAYGNGRFVAGSSRGALYSFDAHNWFGPAPGATFADLCFGNGLFVGVSSGNTIWRSANASNWVSVAAGALVQFSRISFANNRFFALGTEISTPELYISTDGTNWNGPITLGTNAIQKITFGNGLYVGLNPVISSTNLWSEFRTSTNGTNWSLPIIVTNTYVTDALFANGQFVALDEVGATLFSSDGTNWTAHAAPELFGGTKIDWDGSLYVVAGPGGRIVTSPDALTWTRRTTGPQNSLAGIIRTNGLLVAVGGNLYDPYSQSTVITSTDGRDWTERNSGTTNSLTSVAFGNGRYVAVGTNGAIVTSPDAMTWTPATSPTTVLLYSIACGAGQFVAVGGTTNRATILNSSDGLNWTSQTNATNYNTLYSVTFAQGQFVAVGQTNSSKTATLLTSADGLAWTPRISMATNHLRGVGFGNGIYVAVGDSGAIVISSDSLTWTNVSPTTVLSWRAVAYGNGQYVAIASSPPTHAASSNAVNWTLSSALRSLTLQPVYGIAASDNSFFVAGYEGEVLESGPFNSPAPQVNVALRQTAQFFLSFTGPEYHAYELQSSDILPAVWQTELTVSNVSGTTTVPVSASSNAASRFYRAKLLN